MAAVSAAALLPDLDWLASLFMVPEKAYEFRHTFSHGLGVAVAAGLLFWLLLTRTQAGAACLPG